MNRVTGIGGIFFKAKDPKAMQAWYRRHLGIDVQDWGGAAFRWTGKTGEAQPSAGLTQMASLWVEQRSGPSDPPRVTLLLQARLPLW